MAEEEEAPAPEENAEATAPAEAGAEAAAAAPAEAGPPPSLWKPVLLSSIISIAGVVGIFMFVIKPSIESTITMAMDVNATAKKKAEAEKKKAEEEKNKAEEGEEKKPKVDESAGEIPIVEDGDNIVINPAGSSGTRYLLVEIYLIRADKEDYSFKQTILANSKKLKKIVVDKISGLDVQQCTDPSIRPRIVYQLKTAFQQVLGEKHPIKEVIMPTWVMQ